MKAQSASKGLVLLVVFLAFVSADAMTLTFKNNVGREVGIACSMEGTVGHNVVTVPGQLYSYPLPDPKQKYSCQFATTGKVSPVVVHVWQGAGGKPCNCVEPTCAWTVTDVGIGCVNGFYFQAW